MKVWRIACVACMAKGARATKTSSFTVWDSVLAFSGVRGTAGLVRIQPFYCRHP